MKLKWYGTAALLVFQKQVGLAFDPFFGIRRGEENPRKIAAKDVGMTALASEVFVTHGHFDHIIQIPALFARGKSKVHATATPCATLKEHGFPENRLDVISPGWSGSFGEVTVKTFQGRHCRFDIPLVLRTSLRYLRPGNQRHGLRLLRWNKEYPENGEIIFYELECNGKRLQIMGSMGLDESETYPTEADLLVLPYQGRSHPVRYAASLVERLKPKAVLLDHYDDSFPPQTARVDTTAFETLMKETYRIPCRAMRRGITYDTEELTI